VAKLTGEQIQQIVLEAIKEVLDSVVGPEDCDRVQLDQCAWSAANKAVLILLTTPSSEEMVAA
jgi:hypothetical protein